MLKYRKADAGLGRIVGGVRAGPPPLLPRRRMLPRPLGGSRPGARATGRQRPTTRGAPALVGRAQRRQARPLAAGLALGAVEGLLSPRRRGRGAGGRPPPRPRARERSIEPPHHDAPDDRALLACRL